MEGKRKEERMRRKEGRKERRKEKKAGRRETGKEVTRKKRKLFPTRVKCRQIHRKRIGRLWNAVLLPAQYYLIQAKAIKGFCNLCVKCGQEKDIVSSLIPVHLHRLLTHHKGKNGNLAGQTSSYQSSQHQNWIDWRPMSLVVMHREEHNLNSMTFLPKMLNLIVRTQEKFNLRDIL